MKKATIIVGGVILLVILLGLFIRKPLISSKEEKVIKIGMSAASYLSNAPIIIAQEKGLFNQYGLKTEIVPLDSGGLVGQTLATGNLDVGSMSMVPFLLASSKNAPVKILAPSSLTPLDLFVNPKSNITSISDLAGKTIGARPNGGAALVLGSVFDKENVDIRSVKFIDVDEAARPIALMESTIVDAVPDDPYQAKVYMEAGAVLHKGWEEKGYSKVSLVPGVNDAAAIAVNTNFASANSKAIEPFIDAFIESQRFIKNNPDEAADLLSKYVNRTSNGAITLSKEEIKTSWESGSLQYLLWSDPNNLVKITEVAKKIGLIERVPTLEEMFDRRFEEKLKSAQDAIYGSNN